MLKRIFKIFSGSALFIVLGCGPFFDKFAEGIAESVAENIEHIVIISGITAEALMKIAPDLIISQAKYSHPEEIWETTDSLMLKFYYSKVSIAYDTIETIINIDSANIIISSENKQELEKYSNNDSSIIDSLNDSLSAVDILDINTDTEANDKVATSKGILHFATNLIPTDTGRVDYNVESGRINGSIDATVYYDKITSFLEGVKADSLVTVRFNFSLYEKHNTDNTYLYISSDCMEYCFGGKLGDLVKLWSNIIPCDNLK